ncbi:hypothetical protein BgiBS90_035543, partial [Biomphalaria glabrata]
AHEFYAQRSTRTSRDKHNGFHIATVLTKGRPTERQGGEDLNPNVKQHWFYSVNVTSVRQYRDVASILVLTNYSPDQGPR